MPLPGVSLVLAPKGSFLVLDCWSC